MDLNKEIDNLIEVSKYLNESRSRLLLESFKESLADKHFVLPFIGQFTAGKSKLINHILGEEILPTATNETTAYLTYISYGERRAVINYIDGTSEEESVEAIHDIDQSSAKQQEKGIKSIEVTLPVELLKSGLVIADTPGVNTVLSQHVEITENLLNTAQFVVYVLGSSPARQDVDMVKRIEKLGIPVIFVRTKLDLVKSNEENITDVVEKDREVLSKALNRDIDLYPVCNLEGVRDNDIWNEFFKQFLDFLTNDIAKDVEHLTQVTIGMRLQPIHESFKEELKQRNDVFKESSRVKLEDIEAEINALTQKMHTVEREIDRKRRYITRKSKDGIDQLQRDIERKGRDANEDFTDAMQRLFPVTPESVKETFSKELKTSLESINAPIQDAIARWKKKCTSESVNDLETLRGQLQLDPSDFSCDFSSVNVDSYAQERENIQALYDQRLAQLKQLDSMNDAELEKLGVKRDGLKQSLSDMEAAYQASIKAYETEAREYTPQYIQSGGKLGGVLSKVGDAVDLAMLLIPGEGWAKAGTKLGSAAAKVGAKGGAIAQKGAKALEYLSKGAEYMSKADSAKDMATLVKKIEDNGIVKHSGATTPLDLLSASYWMQQLGDYIDPVHVELDQEHQRQHDDRMSLLQMKAQNTAMQRLTEMQKMGMIRSEADRITYKKRLIEQEMLSAKREYEKELSSLKAKQQLEVKQSIISQATSRFGKAIDNYISKLTPRIVDTFEGITENIIEAENEFAMKQLRDRQEALQRVAEAKKAQKESDSDIMAQNDAMISLLAENEDK